LSARVEVRDGETIRSAISRFRCETRRRHQRRWVKRRFGYYERPSDLRRKRKKVADIVRYREFIGIGGIWRPSLGFERQFRREGPFGVAR
jgi:ribosomal protein S21